MGKNKELYISHLLTDENMKHLIEKTDAGIESIEFSIAENLDCRSSRLKNYKKRLEYMGGERLTLHGPFLDLNPVSYDTKIAVATRERYEQVYEAAQYLGAEKVIFHTCFIPQIYYLEGWVEQTSEFWNDFLREKKGIQILLENVYDREIFPLIKVQDAVESADFMLCLDLGHAHCYSEIPVEQWILQMRNRIGHIHIHDNCGDRDSHMALSDGTVPLNTILPLMETLGDQVGYTIECSFYEDVLKSWEIMQQKRNFWKQKL